MNLFVENTGLDHLYINGVPIVSVEVDIEDLLARVRGLSSVSAMTDPYIATLPAEVKHLFQFSDTDEAVNRFLKDGTKDVLRLFQAYQRWIPDGVYGARDLTFSQQISSVYTWTAPDSTLITREVRVTRIDGDGTVTLKVNRNLIRTIDLSATVTYLQEELRGANQYVSEIEVDFTSGDLECTLEIDYVEQTDNSWNKALVESGDVEYPYTQDIISIQGLIVPYTWTNTNNLKVYESVVRCTRGTADVSVNGYGTPVSLVVGAERSDDFRGAYNSPGSLAVEISNASEDFKYDFIISVGIPVKLPSPRLEYDSDFNPGKIIIRWQDLDTRTDKLDYTSRLDTVIDPNATDDAEQYFEESLLYYVLMAMYETVNHDKNYLKYRSKFRQKRRDLAYEVKQGLKLYSRNYGGF